MEEDPLCLCFLFCLHVFLALKFSALPCLFYSWNWNSANEPENEPLLLLVVSCLPNNLLPCPPCNNSYWISQIQPGHSLHPWLPLHPPPSLHSMELTVLQRQAGDCSFISHLPQAQAAKAARIPFAHRCWSTLFFLACMSNSNAPAMPSSLPTGLPTFQDPVWTGSVTVLMHGGHHPLQHALTTNYSLLSWKLCNIFRHVQG